MGSAIAPIYISEISPQQSRGKYVALYTLAIGIGALTVYIVNLMIASGQKTAWIDDIGWRYMFASEMIPAFLFFALLFFVPETPRHLSAKKEYNKALLVLEKVNGSKQKAQEIIGDIKISLNNQSATSARLFSYGKLVVFLGIAIAIFQQLIGINVILYYAPLIFEELGTGQMASMFQTVIVGVVNVIFMSLAILFVDNVGRKPLLIGGAIGCAIFLFSVAILSSLNIFGISTLVFILLFVASFQFSWGVVTWVFVSEIFPNKIRGQATAIAVALHWLANLMISSTFPPLNDLFGSMTFAIYGFLSLVSVFFVWKLVPETKGKTLEELEEIWNKKNSERKEAI